jgi:hypothetical protein
MLLSGWIFLASGPKVQAQADYLIQSDGGGIWFMGLEVWNAGRQDIKVDILSLHALWKSDSGEWWKADSEEDPTKSYIYVWLKPWDGPVVPMMMAAHSGESWELDLSEEERPFGPTGVAAPIPDQLWIELVVGGKRSMNVPALPAFGERSTQEKAKRRA